MKKIIFTLILLVSISALLKAQVPSYVPSNGLVGWWPFSGNALDASSNGNNGTPTNGPTLCTDRNNVSNSAYNFDGVDDYIQTPVSSTDNYSISVWINPFMIAQMNILGNDNEAFSGKSFYLTADSGLSIYSCHPIPAGCAAYPSTVTGNNAIINNIWTHVIASVNSGTVTYYLNGIAAGGGNGVEVYGVNWKIGAKGDFYSQYPFKGKLDDVGIWNRPLTQAEITRLFVGCIDTITTQPTNQIGLKGGSKNFSYTHSGTNINYQWQSNSVALGWQNVPNANQYSGATTNNLSISNLSVSNHNQLFRVVANKAGCAADTSSLVKLQISDVSKDSIELQKANDSIVKINTALLNKHDTLYVGSVVSTDTLKISIHTGLSSATPLVNILKVYPNPASSILHIDLEKPGYYTARISSLSGQTTITPTSGSIDISSLANGVYVLTIYDSKDKLVSTNKIMIVR